MARLSWAVIPLLAGLLLADRAPAAGAYDSGMLVYSTEGNRLRRYDVDSIGGSLVEDVFIASASDDPIAGRDVNGVVCLVPDGSGRYLMAEDTGQTAVPAGWGVFSPDGQQVGKLAATYQTSAPEPFGCAFDAETRLFTTDVGDQGIGSMTGQLILWFPPYDRFPGAPGSYPNGSISDNFCKIDTSIGTAAQVLIDGQGRVYVAGSGQLNVFRFSPPFPTSPDAAGGCGQVDSQGSPLADSVQKEVFIPSDGLTAWSGLALAPNGNIYVATNLTGEIREYDLDGNLVRKILDPMATSLPIATGNPQSLAVADDGTLYYADLDLQGTLPNVYPGPDGKVRRITFDAMNNASAPVVVRSGLAFPDGVALHPGNLEPLTEWTTYAGSLSRLFFNPDEEVVNNLNVTLLQQRWGFDTGAIITGSPTVAEVDVPGEGRIQVVYFLSWDLHVYAVRLREGTELWSVATEDQPGATFPTVASVDVSQLGGVETVFVGAGEIMYALDAITGAEIWRFTAGTGCEDGMGQPPGLCGFSSERNEIESSVAVSDGKVFFGMDVNDVETGKGGFYALDAVDGRLAWYFDLETGSTCYPDPTDDIRRFDGYHSEAELGLPAGFLATRFGCNFDRSVTGCGNVWSSPAVDEGRGLLFFASSNCDTDNDAGTARPPPPMPAHDEAIVALQLDGTPAWRWRPREVDNADLAFGAAPNLFSIDFGGGIRDVVGVGNKDGTYYVLDRDGTNEVSGVAWNDVDPSMLPYWSTNLVAGGDIGGILATAAVDQGAGRIYVTTAPGDGAINGPPAAPQRPTVHALDMDTGVVVWDDAADTNAFASFAPTSAIPGVVFAGHVPLAYLRFYDSALDAGTKLGQYNITNFALASAPVVIDGIVLVGGGIGTRTASGTSSSDQSAAQPTQLKALCVPGTVGCARCGDAQVDAGEECDDGNLDDADSCWSTCESTSRLVLDGQPLGGTIRFIVDGVSLEVSTHYGDSIATIRDAIVAAIANDAGLSARGVSAFVSGSAVVSNGTVTTVVVDDPGIGPKQVPLLAGPVSWWFLVGSMLALGATALRFERTRSAIRAGESRTV